MSIWNKIYQAYEEKDCQQLKKLFDELTQKDKESLYFSEYWSLYVKQCLEKEKFKKGKISFKGKVIKCPHCGASVTKSVYNNESIKKLKQGKKTTKFICNYCGNDFFYSKKLLKSIFSNYRVGQEIELKNKKYNISGGVRYKGNYYEDGKVGSLEYIEWLAYDKKGELFYITESRAKDSEGIYDEIEISQKINFSFVIKNYNKFKIETNKLFDFGVKEYDEVEVITVFGEVNKVYKIGEKVKLYAFKNYILEIEKGRDNIERNLYKVAYRKKVNNSNLEKKIIFNDVNECENCDMYISIFPIIFILIMIIISDLVGIDIGDFMDLVFIYVIASFFLYIILTFFFPKLKFSFVILIVSFLLSFFGSYTFFNYIPNDKFDYIFYNIHKKDLPNHIIKDDGEVIYSVNDLLRYELDKRTGKRKRNKEWYKELEHSPPYITEYYKKYPIKNGYYIYTFKNDLIGEKIKKSFKLGGTVIEKRIVRGFQFSIKDKNDRKSFEHLINNMDKFNLTSNDLIIRYKKGYEK